METNEETNPKVTATECPCARSICELYVIASEDGQTAWQKEEAERYAEAINSLPALLQALRQFGKHKETCDFFVYEKGKVKTARDNCTCGLTAALAAVEEKEKG